jgi:hypothetical protein
VYSAAVTRSTEYTEYAGTKRNVAVVSREEDILLINGQEFEGFVDEEVWPLVAGTSL